MRNEALYNAHLTKDLGEIVGNHPTFEHYKTETTRNSQTRQPKLEEWLVTISKSKTNLHGCLYSQYVYSLNYTDFNHLMSDLFTVCVQPESHKLQII